MSKYVYFCLCVILIISLLLPLLSERNLIIINIFDFDFFTNKIIVYNCWADQIKKSHQLFLNLSCPDTYPGCHAGKMAFRFTIPILLKILGSERSVYYSQFFLGIFFLYSCFLLAKKISSDSTIGFLFLICFTSIYAGYAFIYEYNALGDAFAFCFLMGALSFRQLWVQFIFLQLAFWTDERSLIASVGIAIFWLVIEGDKFMINFSFKNIPKLIKTNKSIQVLLTTWFIYGCLRYSMSVFLGLSIPKDDANFSVLTDHFLPSIIITIINSHKFLLFFLVTGAIYLYRIGAWFMLFIYTVYIVGYHVTSHMVYDSDRSIAYSFPIYFVALYLSMALLRENLIKKILVVGMIINSLIFPLRHFVTNKPLRNIVQIKNSL